MAAEDPISLVDVSVPPPQAVPDVDPARAQRVGADDGDGAMSAPAPAPAPVPSPHAWFFHRFRWMSTRSVFDEDIPPMEAIVTEALLARKDDIASLVRLTMALASTAGYDPAPLARLVGHGSRMTALAESGMRGAPNMWSPYHASWVLVPLKEAMEAGSLQHACRAIRADVSGAIAYAIRHCDVVVGTIATRCVREPTDVTQAHVDDARLRIIDRMMRRTADDARAVHAMVQQAFYDVHPRRRAYLGIARTERVRAHMPV